MPGVQALKRWAYLSFGQLRGRITKFILRKTSSDSMTSRNQTILITFTVVITASLVVFGVLAGAAVIGYRAAERSANEAATIQNMKTIAAVETQYFNIHNRTYATFDQLVREELLSRKFAGHPVVADGYVLTLKLSQSDNYTLTADPSDRSSGKRHFYFDSTSIQIRVNQDGPAGPSDPEL
jgi:type II secretory pathway pseudopilin PulG